MYFNQVFISASVAEKIKQVLIAKNIRDSKKKTKK